MQWANRTSPTRPPDLSAHAMSQWDSIHFDLNFQSIPWANGTPSTFPWTFSPCPGPMGLHPLCRLNFQFMLWVDGAPLSHLNFQSMQWATWTPHHHLTFQSMHIHTKLLHRQHSRSIRITATLTISASFSPHPEKYTHFQSNLRAHPSPPPPPLPENSDTSIVNLHRFLLFYLYHNSDTSIVNLHRFLSFYLYHIYSHFSLMVWFLTHKFEQNRYPTWRSIAYVLCITHWTTASSSPLLQRVNKYLQWICTSLSINVVTCHRHSHTCTESLSTQKAGCKTGICFNGACTFPNRQQNASDHHKSRAST